MGKANVVNLLNVDDPVSCLIRAPPHHAFYPCTPLNGLLLQKLFKGDILLSLTFNFFH